MHAMIHLLCSDNPQGEIIQNQFSMPLPRISNREVVAMKIWIPETLTTDNRSGMYAVYLYVFMWQLLLYVYV